MNFSNFDTNLNLILVIMVALKEIQNISTQFIFFCIIYTNFNYKLLAKIKKPAIFKDKFKKLILKKCLKIFKKKKREKIRY